jgi:hypothetical protein
MYGPAVSLCVQNITHNAGLATSLLGFAQFSCASFVASLVVQPPIMSPVKIITVLLVGSIVALAQITLFDYQQQAPQTST